MSAKPSEKIEQYPEIQTTKDGRQYVTIIDVLRSSAARAEMRRQAETQIPARPANKNEKSEGSASKK